MQNLLSRGYYYRTDRLCFSIFKRFPWVILSAVIVSASTALLIFFRSVLPLCISDFWKPGCFNFLKWNTDWCCAIWTTSPSHLIGLQYLQYVQTSSAKVTHTKQWAHITHILCKLHWLWLSHPCIHYDTLLLTFKCLNGIFSHYISYFIPRFRVSFVVGS